MRQYFVDTSGFLAEVVVDDDYHEEATRIAEELQRKNTIGMTTSYILSETLTFLRLKVGHSQAVQFYKIIEQSARLSIIYPGPEEFKDAFEIFEQYQDKHFSFVDCISFAIMRKRKIINAFSFDNHFRQAGFEILQASPQQNRKSLK